MEQRVQDISQKNSNMSYNLELLDKAISKYKLVKPSNILDVIEMHNIKKMIDDNCRLTKSSNEKVEELKDGIKGYNSIIIQFFQSTNFNSLTDSYNSLEWSDKLSFWDIIDQFNLYNVATEDFINKVTKADNNNLRAILYYKNLIEKNKNLIRNLLIDNEFSAIFLVNKYIARLYNPTDRDMFLPSNLTIEDKEHIINNYLDSKNPKLNIVRLICQNKNDKNLLFLSPLTKVKAYKLAKKLNEDLMIDPHTAITKQLFCIRFCHKKSKEPLSFITEENCPTLIYNANYIKSCNNLELIANFKNLFGWINNDFLVDLINKDNEVSSIESIAFVRSKNTYPTYANFINKNRLSYNQLQGYEFVLSGMKSSIEQELKTFYEKQLVKDFNYPSLDLNFPNLTDNYLSKCRVLFPELDSIVKQYETFVKYNKISSDIIKFSEPIKITEGISLLTNKYYEINDDHNELQNILWYMFASNSHLYYVKPYEKSNYNCLYDLLNNETVYYENYENFQKPNLDLLIEQKIINKDEKGIISLETKELSKVLKSLWIYKACAYWHCSENEKKVLDQMYEKKWLVKSEYLLTTEERKYFSYYLDNKLYTNGPAYRNHYAHGSLAVGNEENHKVAYFVFLRLLAIIILKIWDDLLSAQEAFYHYIKYNQQH